MLINNPQQYFHNEIKEQAIFVFGPFLKKYNYNFPEEWGDVEVSFLNIIRFRLLGFLRKINEKYIKKHSGRRSIKGTIYGDMQRKNLN